MKALAKRVDAQDCLLEASSSLRETQIEAIGGLTKGMDELNPGWVGSETRSWGSATTSP